MPQSKKLFIFDFQYFQGENAKACKSSEHITFCNIWCALSHAFFHALMLGDDFMLLVYFLCSGIRVRIIYIFFMYALTVRKIQYNVDLHINILCCLPACMYMSGARYITAIPQRKGLQKRNHMRER